MNDPSTDPIPQEPSTAPPTLRSAPWILPPPRQVEIDAEGRIAQQVLCRRCGYDLRGRPINGVCSECGTSVARSVHGDFLRLSDPRWVEKLAHGTLWVTFGLLGGIVLGMVMGMTGALYGFIGRSLNFNVITAVGMIVAVSAASVQVIGYWLVTTPDPGSPPEERISARIVARYALMAVVVAALSQGVVQAASQTMSGQQTGAMWMGVLGSPTGRSLILLAATVSIICQAVGYFALFRYAGSLAGRIPHPSLAWQSKVVMWGFTAMQVLAMMTTVLVFQALPALFGPGGITPGAGGGGPGPSVTCPRGGRSTPGTPRRTSGTASSSWCATGIQRP